MFLTIIRFQDKKTAKETASFQSIIKMDAGQLHRTVLLRFRIIIEIPPCIWISDCITFGTFSWFHWISLIKLFI